MEELEAAGCVRGVEFVPICGDDLIDPMPDWLTMELEPTGNSPELEAEMDPEVREIWERTRGKLYSFRAGS